MRTVVALGASLSWASPALGHDESEPRPSSHGDESARGSDKHHEERSLGHEHGSLHHGSTHHDHHSFELGLSPSLAYLVEDGEFAFSAHAHLLRVLGQSPWAFGIGYERVFDEHVHDTFNVVGQLFVLEGWSVALAPGLTLSEGWTELEPSLHLETAYELLTGDAHLGPAFEVALHPEEIHVSLGVHVGLGF